MADLRAVADRYFRAWEARDRAGILREVDANLEFRSPADDFDTAAAFLDQCLEPLGGMKFDWKTQLVGDDEMMVAYEMPGPEGPMPIAERLRFADGKIAAIRVYFGQKMNQS